MRCDKYDDRAVVCSSVIYVVCISRGTYAGTHSQQGIVINSMCPSSPSVVDARMSITPRRRGGENRLRQLLPSGYTEVFVSDAIWNRALGA